MPTEAKTITGTAWAGNPLVVVAQIQGLDGAYIQQADISAVTYVDYDLDNASAQVTSGSFAPSSCIYNQLQTGLIWAEDTLGYNFKVTLPAVCFPIGNRRYRILITFATVASGNIVQPCEFYAMAPAG